MQDTTTIHSTATSELATRGLDVTAGDIQIAYNTALGKLKACTDKASEFIDACTRTGKLLSAKKAAVGHGNWESWLGESCPEISPVTAYRLMKIYEVQEANLSRGKDLQVTVPLTSIRSAFEFLQAPSKAEEKKAKEEAEAKEAPKEEAAKAAATKGEGTGEGEGPPSRIADAIARFWGAISRRPVEKWDGEERRGFIEDIRERARLIRENSLTAEGIVVREDGVIEIEIEIVDTKPTP